MPSTSKPGMNEAPIGGTSTVAPTSEGSTMESTVTRDTLGTTGAYPTELPLPPLGGDPAGSTRVASTGAPTVVYTGQGYTVAPADIGFYCTMASTATATLGSTGAYPTEIPLPPPGAGDPAGAPYIVEPPHTVLQATGKDETATAVSTGQRFFVGELSEHPTGGSMASTGGGFRELTSDESITPAASTGAVQWTAPSTAKPGHCHTGGMFAWMAEPQSTAQRKLRFHLKK